MDTINMGIGHDAFGASYGMLLVLTFVATLIAFLTTACYSDWSSKCRKIGQCLSSGAATER